MRSSLVIFVLLFHQVFCGRRVVVICRIGPSSAPILNIAERDLVNSLEDVGLEVSFIESADAETDSFTGAVAAFLFDRDKPEVDLTSLPQELWMFDQRHTDDATGAAPHGVASETVLELQPHVLTDTGSPSIQVESGISSMDYSYPDSHPNLTTLIGDPAKPAYFYFERGTIMPSGKEAPARRVSFHVPLMSVHSADRLKLFDLLASYIVMGSCDRNELPEPRTVAMFASCGGMLLADGLSCSQSCDQGFFSEVISCEGSTWSGDPCPPCGPVSQCVQVTCTSASDQTCVLCNDQFYLEADGGCRSCVNFHNRFGAGGGATCGPCRDGFFLPNDGDSNGLVACFPHTPCASGEYQAAPGTNVRDNACAPCMDQDYCVYYTTECAFGTPFLACVNASEGYYVNNGVVTECSAGCATCDDGDSCSSCTSPYAAVASSGLCECVEGYFGNGAVCTDVDLCEGNTCGAGGDALAECVYVSDSEVAEVACTCSTGFEDVDGTCTDIDMCVGSPCQLGGDADAACIDGTAPSLSFTCDCSPGFSINGTTCSACPDRCSECTLPAGACTACLSADATLTEVFRCECNTGTHEDGQLCTACAVSIPGCGECSSATECTLCSVGELAEDGSACVTSAGVIDGGQQDEEGGSDTVSIALGSVAGALVCCVAVLVVALLAKSRKSTDAKTKRFTITDSEATVQLDKGSFGTFLKEKIATSKPIASGGFGSVYRITLEDGKEVALKVLAADACEAAKAEFHRESTILTKLTVLNSPLIVAMACFCEDPMCIGMEFAEKGTLMDRVKQGPMSGDALMAALEDTAAPLAFLHNAGFAHLDVKPQNYLVLKDDRVVICDFGLSMSVDSGDKAPSSTGTPHYLAPERYFELPGNSGASVNSMGSATSKATVVRMDDPRMADVFSWGIMGWVFTAGEAPFSSVTAQNIPSMMALQGMRPSFGEATAVHVKALAEECWAHDPAMRPQMSVAMRRLSPDSTAILSNASVDSRRSLLASGASLVDM